MQMAIRRSRTYPYFQGKAEDLYARSVSINDDLDDIQIAMAPQLSAWAAQLNAAHSELLEFRDLLLELEDGQGLEVLNWIVEFAGSLGVITTKKRNVEAALADTRATVEALSGKIAFVNNYLNDLAKRQDLSQLSVWRTGTDLLLMTENVAKSFGTTQREMLQGWWQMPTLLDGGQYIPNEVAEARYEYLRSEVKPWQPVCDLYQHRVDPRSWAEVERRRLGWDPSYAGYGTVTTTIPGTGEGGRSGLVYFRQPKEGQPGYRRISGADKDIWGVTRLEEGCLASGVCPVAPWTSPMPRTRKLIYVQDRGLTLVTPFQIGRLMRSVASSIAGTSSHISATHTALGVLSTAVMGAGVWVKGQIRAILESTGGPTALRATGMAIGTLGGPVGWFIGWVVTESVITAAIAQLWTKVSEGPSISKEKAETAKDLFRLHQA